MSFNPNYVQSTLAEAASIGATTIAERYALETLAKNGSVTIEETENVYDIALRLLTEGSEDMIPETLDLPDAQDAAVDADVAAAGGDEDLDISDLEGIVLPDSEGNQYIIQGGILVPYGDEDEGDDASGGDSVAAEAGASGGDATDDDIEEGTQVATTEGTEQITEGTVENDATPQVIEENTIFASTSEFVKNLVNAKIK